MRGGGKMRQKCGGGGHGDDGKLTDDKYDRLSTKRRRVGRLSGEVVEVVRYSADCASHFAIEGFHAGAEVLVAPGSGDGDGESEGGGPQGLGEVADGQHE